MYSLISVGSVRDTFPRFPLPREQEVKTIGNNHRTRGGHLPSSRRDIAVRGVPLTPTMPVGLSAGARVSNHAIMTLRKRRRVFIN